MRTAETILRIIHDRGRRGLPLERLYRLLYTRDLYLLAYGRLARNRGAMTPGVTPETIDGMTLDKIDAIIAALRRERYHWTPVRRVYVEKKRSTKRRAIGIPAWSDKLLQEVIRLLLEAYYEPQFSPTSHGFRPGRGCHTALDAIYHRWIGTKWFIEGDVAQCFDRLDHSMVVSILAEQIHDGRFLRLIALLLKAGYLEDWRYHATLSGSPQGSGLSPLLANLYLDKLDRYVEAVLLPASTRGERRRPNPPYSRLRNQMHRQEQQGEHERARHLRRQMQQLPSLDPGDPDYRRLHYLRYADDWLLGFAGPRQEAEEIKAQLATFLRDELKLELSQEKTLITHAQTGAARFLGYEIVVLNDDQKRDRRGYRSINGQIGLKIPQEVVQAKCARYCRRGKAGARPELLHDSAYSIVVQYQQEYRGLVAYYRLAYNLHQLNRLKWIMEWSLTQTLAAKLKISVRQVYRRYQTTLQTEHGPRTGLQVTVPRGAGDKPLVATWGGISLARDSTAVLNDQPTHIWGSHTELEQRLLADTCELCGSHDAIEVHHIRALKDLHRKGRAAKPFWIQIMAARQRKTLVTCHRCHTAIHAGQLHSRDQASTGAPDDQKCSRPVRRGRLEKYQTNWQLASRLPYFVVTCTTRKEAEQVIDRLIPWLAERGLNLSQEKTRIVHIRDGFDFLGFNVRQYDAPGSSKSGTKLLIKPSRDSVLRIRERLRDEWLSLRGHSVTQVITRLNPIIRGWANYFRPAVSFKTFEALDDWMFRREVRYVRHSHPTKSWHWMKVHYWGNLHRQRNENWVFGDKHAGNTLLRFSWFSIERHILVKGTASPDDPALREYWANRQRSRARVLSPSHRKIAQRQGYKCDQCGEPLLNDEELHVHHKTWRSRGGRDTYGNLTLRHLYCHQQIHARKTP